MCRVCHAVPVPDRAQPALARLLPAAITTLRSDKIDEAFGRPFNSNRAVQQTEPLHIFGRHCLLLFAEQARGRRPAKWARQQTQLAYAGAIAVRLAEEVENGFKAGW